MSKLELNESQRFEAVKYRHEDQVNTLQFIKNVDIKLFSSFITLQLVFCGFIATSKLASFSKIGLFIVDMSLAIVCSSQLWHNYRRRKELVKTIKNCNEALGYETENLYLENATLNAKTTFRPWIAWNIAAVLISIVGAALIIFT